MSARSRWALWAWAAAILAGACAAAFAQATAPDPLPEPPDPPDPPVVFREPPREADISRNYPREAFSAGQEGRAILCCLVTENDGLACAAVAESPTGYGFGDAARIIASRFRLTPQSASEWRARGGVLRLPIIFRVARDPIAAPPIQSEPSCGVQASVGLP